MNWKLLLCLFSCGTLFAGTVTELPLKEVTLYSSGVGTFVHQGNVEGKTAVRFRMSQEQLNDLLKSLYVTAAGEGVSIHSVTYPTKLPMGTLLENYRIRMDRVQSLSDILRQLRGEEFQMEVAGADLPVKGKLIAVETKRITIQTGSVGRTETLEYAVLLTEKGIRRLSVAELTSVVPTDKALMEQMTKVLAVLADQQDKSLRVMEIHLEAKKPSPVRMAYVIESPVWKSSYRLELPEKKGDANLQGWAMVENPTNTEWKDVTLSLISGRPESFIQDLYTSIFLPRPKVEREIFVSNGPVRHDIGADANEKPMLFGGRAAKRKYAPVPAANPVAECADGIVFKHVESGTAVAKAPVGELCCYRIAKPVTLGSRQSAMLELISTPVPAEKISFYSMKQREKYPLNAVLLKNKTGLLLPQGPVTIFEGKNYGGDASLSDLPSGQEQILSYGTDLEVLALPGNDVFTTGKISDLVIDRGMLKYSQKRMIVTKCTFENKSKKDKVILFETPRSFNGRIIGKLTPSSMTADAYRFTIPLKAGKKITAEVQEEIFLRQSISVNSYSDFTGFIFASEGVELSRESKALAEKLLAFSRKIKDLQLELRNVDEKIRDLSTKQNRTRSNINANISNELRTRLNKRLADDDDALEKQYQKKDTLKAEIQELQKELGAFLEGKTK